MNSNYEKIGYLNANYKMFHLTDYKIKDFSYHYHDFDKILILISGDVTYHIEGKTFKLEPYDIVLVNAFEVHKPVIQSNSTYERIIIYISHKFIDSYKNEHVDLSKCFKNAKENNANVLRINSFKKSKLYLIINELEESFKKNLFGNELYQKTLFIEFLIHLNRLSINKQINYIETNYSNKKILSIIKYINKNLSKDISIDFLSSHFFISKYHLMHSFKNETGFTINNYITTKRLLYAKSLIEEGTSVTNACYECGFKNYSTFSRAYKKVFHTSAKKDKY